MKMPCRSVVATMRLITLLSPLAAYAQITAASGGADKTQVFDDRFVPTWTAACSFAKGAARLAFQSKSGDPTEDDMTMHVQSSSGEGALPIPSALYVAGHFKSTIPSRCDRLAAYDMPSGNVLLILIRDDRPSEDRAVALLVAPHAEAIVAGPIELGHIWQSLEIVPERSGARVRVLVETKTGAEAVKYRWIRIRSEGQTIYVP